MIVLVYGKLSCALAGVPNNSLRGREEKLYSTL